MHTRVHDQEQSECQNGVVTMRSLPLRSLSLGLYGVADVVEFHPDEENGILIKGYLGSYTPKPIEYKHGKSKANDCDRLQLCAQALCLEEMLGCRVGQAEIFYGETRRRERVFLEDTLRQKTINLCAEMRRLYDSGITPPPQPSPACSRCSLQQICLPTSSKRSAVIYWKSVLKGLMEGS